MNTVNVYDNGFPFDDTLKANIDDQIERVKNNRASLIIFDGPVGIGKTTAAVIVADYINYKRGLQDISLDIKDHPQMALGGEQFGRNLRVCFEKNLPTIVYDESGDFSKRGSISAFNQQVNRIFETYRGFKIIVMLCLPKFYTLDNQIFDNEIPRMLINIKERSKSYVDFRAYGLNEMNWIRYYIEKRPKAVRNKCYGYVEPNFRGHMLNLDDARAKQLDKLSTLGKISLLEDIEISMAGLISYYEIAKKVRKSPIWVKLTLKKLGITPKSFIHRKAYFDEKNTISALYTFMDVGKEEHEKQM